jgi:endonuclease/exonuclease/phosphatase family metal-dependent hydrolase
MRVVHRRPRLVASVGLVGLLLGQLVAGPASAAGAPRPVRVMTLNLYIGADVRPALLPGLTPLQVVQAVTGIWATAQATDLPSRARALAAQIREADPHVIAVQEAALWRVGPLGVMDPTTKTATTVVYDALSLLHAELAAAGAPYRTVVTREVFDAEVPTLLGHEVRLTESEAILVRDGLPADELAVLATGQRDFVTNFSVDVGGVTIPIRRGWTAADLVVNRRAFRLLTVHLEPNVGVLRPLQAQELLAPGAAGGAPGPVVIAGDLNSAPGDPAATNGYATLVGAGFTDAWAAANPGVDGFTCCQAENLLSPASSLTRRIDHLLVDGGAVVSARRYLVDPDARTRSGLWPSDHAAVVGAIQP